MDRCAAVTDISTSAWAWPVAMGAHYHLEMNGIGHGNPTPPHRDSE
jgi:hypothetical protein